MAAQQQRTQPSIFLTFKVLQFVNQLRRRLKPRSEGVTHPSILGSRPCLALESKGLGAIAKGLSRVCVQERKQLQHSSYRVSKGRKNRCARPSLKLQLLEQGDAPNPDASAGKVQHMLSSLDAKLSPSGDALSAVAGNAALFLKQNNSANFESCSLNDTIQYLAAVHDAINVFNACRSQYDDEWLIAQGAELGLNIDELFIANYEHLLLRLRTELIDTLARKVLEALLDGGHDKRQRRLLNWFSEFSDKPRPLSTFPWTIKPSLAVLWGVCWMFYNAPGHQNQSIGNYHAKAAAAAAGGDGDGTDRVPLERLLQNVDFSSWGVPQSNDYFNFGLELTGTQSQPGAQQAAGTVGPGAVDFQARNADTWAADLVSTEFRAPSVGIRQAGAGVASRVAATAPHSTSLNTYFSDFPHHQGFSIAHPHPHSHHQRPRTTTNTSLPLPDLQVPDLPDLPGPPGNATLTVFPQQHIDVNVNSLNQSWQQLPPTSLPHRSPRHLTSIPSVRVTGSTDSEGYTPPHNFASYNIYHSDVPAPEAPHSQLNLVTDLDFVPSTFDMGNVPPPESSPVHPISGPRHERTPSVNSNPNIPTPGPRHERTPSVNSNSNIPTPVSMAGPRSPLISPSHDRRPSFASIHSHGHSRSLGHIRRPSEDVSSQDGDDIGSPRRNHAYKRSEEPPRNHEGKMICKHDECRDQTFERKCEWSKHMDKHDRPYKCNVKGCEKLQGFTYSGGLLRHEREVHKMHGGTKKSLYCPFPDCKRSSGSGFTRKENLAEHIRRVHRRTSMSADLGGLIIPRRDSSQEPLSMGVRGSSESPFSRLVDVREDDEHISLKRKRMSESGLPDSGVEELHSELKRLRRENEEKDARLRQLEQAVMALQQSSRR